MRRAAARRLVFAAVGAGLAAAVVEMLFVLPIQAMLGNSPEVVFQSIASGLLGRAAFSGGGSTAALGAALHTFISLVCAAAYVGAAVRMKWLWRRPLIGGMLCGFVAYLVMTFVVIPLSAIGFHRPPSILLWGISFSVHLFAFGLPISLVATTLRSAPRA